MSSPIFEVELERLIRELGFDTVNEYSFFDSGGSVTFEIAPLSYGELSKRIRNSIYVGKYAGVPKGLLLALPNRSVIGRPMFADFHILFEIEKMKCHRVVATLQKIRVFNVAGEREFNNFKSANAYLEETQGADAMIEVADLSVDPEVLG